MSSTTLSVARAAILLVRVLQFVLGALGAVFVLGGVLGNVNIISFAVLGITALVLVAFAGLLELLAVRPMQRRWSA